MSFDRSKPKRQRLELRTGHQNQVTYDPNTSLNLAQPLNSENRYPASWASIVANVNVEIPTSQHPGITTAIDCPVAIRVNGRPCDSTSALHSTSHIAVTHQYQCAQESTQTQGILDTTNSLTPPDGNGQISSLKRNADDETEVCYGMVITRSADC
jgi:hypothetical protein